MHAALLSPMLHINYSSLLSRTAAYLYSPTASQALYAHIWTGSIITAVLGGMVYGTEVWGTLIARGVVERNETHSREERNVKDDAGTGWEDLEGDTDVEG
jgi:hypothetical protein